MKYLIYIPITILSVMIWLTWKFFILKSKIEYKLANSKLFSLNNKHHIQKKNKK